MAEAVTISKTVTFDAAHRLPFHEGLCKNLHGHTYKLEVFFTSTPSAAAEGGEEGNMVMDFYKAKQLITSVVEKLDHATLVAETDVGLKEACMKLTTKTFLCPHETTVENLIREIHYIIVHKLFLAGLYGVDCNKVKLWETPTSCCEYSEV